MNTHALQALVVQSFSVPCLAKRGSLERLLLPSASVEATVKNL